MTTRLWGFVPTFRIEKKIVDRAGMRERLVPPEVKIGSEVDNHMRHAWSGRGGKRPKNEGLQELFTAQHGNTSRPAEMQSCLGHRGKGVKREGRATER